MFICILTNENTGREGEAPAEPFSPLWIRRPLLVDVQVLPDKAPQERRPPVAFSIHGKHVYRGGVAPPEIRCPSSAKMFTAMGSDPFLDRLN